MRPIDFDIRRQIRTDDQLCGGADHPGVRLSGMSGQTRRVQPEMP
jgi:hypothetical protein